MAAAVPDDRKELAEAVAAFNVQPKHPKHKKSAAMGGKQIAAAGGKSNRQRWHELAKTVVAIHHEADKRDQHRGRKVSPEKVADELDARRRGEGVTVANFCKQLIKEYREQVPAAQRGTKGAAKEAV